MYLYGFIRQHTGSYTEMSLLLIFLSVLGYFFATQLHEFAERNPGAGTSSFGKDDEEKVARKKKFGEDAVEMKEGKQVGGFLKKGIEKVRKLKNKPTNKQTSKA